MGQLNNLYISSSFQGLLKMTDSTQGLTNTLQTIQTGDGDNSPLQMSLTQVNISGSLTVNGSPITGSTVNTGSFATTGSNTFTGNQLITGSDGSVILRGSTSGTTDNSFLSVHANNDGPWIGRYFNDTFSTGSSVLSFWGDNDGTFHFHNESTASIKFGVDNYGDNFILNNTNTLSNRDLIVSGAIKTNGNIQWSESSFNYLDKPSGALYFSTINNGTLHLNDDGGEGDVFIGWGPNNTHIRGNTDITGSLYSTNIIGTGSLFLQPNQSDVRFLEIYNTSPTDTHITASGGQIFLGDDVTYVKVDNYGSVERIDVVAGNELVVSSSVINLTGSLHQSGTFYPDVIDWVSSSIVQGTGSYVLTTDLEGVTQYDTYANVASALQPYIQTGSFATTGSNTFYGNQNVNVASGQNEVSLAIISGSGGDQLYLSAQNGQLGLTFANKGNNFFQTNGNLIINNNIGGDGSGSISINVNTGSFNVISPKLIINNGNITTTGSLVASGSLHRLIGNTQITGSLVASGSLHRLIGNTVITGSLIVSGSGININSGLGPNIVNNIIGRTMIYGGSGLDGQTPRLIVSGSDGANTLIGRSFISVDTTTVPGFGANINMYGDDTSTVNYVQGVYNPNDYSNDNELNIVTSTGGTQFKDFDNFNVFDYEDFLVIPPNLGDSPIPQFTRGLGVTGSLKVSGNVMFASGSNKTMGRVALNGGNPGTATVSNTLVTTSSLIFLTKQTNNHPNAGPVVVSSKGSSTFTITSNHNGDTDTVAYQIINPA